MDAAPTAPQAELAEVRRILGEKRPPEETVRAIRKALEPPIERRPVERTDRGWPVLRASVLEGNDALEIAR